MSRLGLADNVVQPQHDHNNANFAGKPLTRSRRHYHGDRHLGTMDTSEVYKWVEPYKTAARKQAAKCREVIAKYEDQVAQYGYSLQHLHQLTTDLPHLRSHVL